MKVYGLVVFVLVGFGFSGTAELIHKVESHQKSIELSKNIGEEHLKVDNHTAVENQGPENEHEQIQMPRGRILFKLKPKNHGAKRNRATRAHHQRNVRKHSNTKHNAQARKNNVGKLSRGSRIKFLRKLFGGGGSLESNAPQLNDARIVVHSFAPPPKQQSNVIHTFNGHTSAQVIQTRIKIPANNLPGRINNLRIRV